jgi:hypothetical protein
MTGVILCSAIGGGLVVVSLCLSLVNTQLPTADDIRSYFGLPQLPEEIGGEF